MKALKDLESYEICSVSLETQGNFGKYVGIYSMRRPRVNREADKCIYRPNMLI